MTVAWRAAAGVSAVVALLVAFPVLGGGARAGHGDDDAGCYPAGSTTVAASRRVRVFLTARSDFFRSYYACVKAIGKWNRLADADSRVYGGRRLDINGTVLAYAGRFYGDESDYFGVAIEDLGKPRRARGFVEFEALPRAVVVSRSRSAVATVCQEVDCRRRGASVVAFRPPRADGYRLVDRAPGLDPRSLRRDGRTVTWRVGREQRSMQLR